MKSYRASVDIDAPREKVWRILTDADSYPEWDPGMDHIEGRIALGEKVKFFTKLDPTQAFPVKVTTFEPGKMMVFTGGMPLGLFKSVRTHNLTRNRSGGTTFETQEVFSGPLLSFFERDIPDLTENFESFAVGLKIQAEKGGA
jgi:uncharacterized protein YndB with AHSA1/START domain